MPHPPEEFLDPEAEYLHWLFRQIDKDMLTGRVAEPTKYRRPPQTEAQKQRARELARVRCHPWDPYEPHENWHEPQVGFIIPRTIPAAWFPPFEQFFDPDLPDPAELMVLPGFGIPPHAWIAWSAAQRCDRPLKLPPDVIEQIAWRKYGTARYVALVPAWRRKITALVTELDDIEDQLSTILWILEGLVAKVIPIPRSLLNIANDVRHYLDSAEKLLSGFPSNRGSKAAWRENVRERVAAKGKARGSLAKMTLWLRDNYARLLEAAQATGTWFDVGIVLGPIIGYVEEGAWALARATVDNYLIAADAMFPGIREDFQRNAEELYANIENAVDETYERMWRGAVSDFENAQMLDFDPETYMLWS